MQGECKEGSVLTCRVDECSYNDSEICHAPGIQVGGEHAMCASFTTDRSSGRNSDMADVGRCDATMCAFNSGQGCGAPGITVEHHEQHADCATYRAMV